MKKTRIGIGSPVGSGKTALVQALTPRLLVLAAIFGTDERCLSARVFSIEVSMTHCSRQSLATFPASRSHRRDGDVPSAAWRPPGRPTGRRRP